MKPALQLKPSGQRNGDTSATLPAVLAACTDLVLTLDGEGVIESVSLGDLMEPHPGWQTLIGRSWSSTVAPDSQGKVELLLNEARTQRKSKPREVNQRTEGVGDAPFRFSAVLDDRERVLALGRDLRPVAKMQQRLVASQQAMDVEYGRLRQVDTRYRVFFQVAVEGVVVADATTGRILEANPAAASMLGDSAQALQAQAVSDLFEAPSAQAVQALIAAVIGGARPSEMSVHLRGQADRKVTLSASVFRQTGATLVLVRFWSAGSEASPWAVRASRVLAVAEAMPDGFVVTGEDQRILSVNSAFCELVSQANEKQVLGEPLDRWLGRPGVDLAIILANLREHGSVRNFATIIRGDFGPPQEALVAAVSALDGRTKCLGFTIRALSSSVNSSRPMPQVPRSVDQLRQLVGRVSLKDLVRESSDMIERLCIEAALDVSGNNRASAAQLLGLSRQGLYLKLKRHGLEESGAPDNRKS